MFSIPFYFILIAYFLYLAIFLIFSIANVYHIYASGTFTFPAIAVTTIVSLICVAILFVTFMNVASINWGTVIVFFGPGGILSFE